MRGHFLTFSFLMTCFYYCSCSHLNELTHFMFYCITWNENTWLKPGAGLTVSIKTTKAPDIFQVVRCMCFVLDGARRTVQTSEVLWTETAHCLTLAKPCGISTQLAGTVFSAVAPPLSGNFSWTSCKTAIERLPCCRESSNVCVIVI